MKDAINGAEQLYEIGEPFKKHQAVSLWTYYGTAACKLPFEILKDLALINSPTFRTTEIIPVLCRVLLEENDLPFKAELLDTLAKILNNS